MQSEVGASDAGVRVPAATSQQLNEENLRAIPSIASGGAKTWQTYAAASAGESATGERKFTAYDPQGRAHDKIHTPSVADTEESYATTRASRMTDRELVRPSCIFPNEYLLPCKPLMKHL